MFSITQSSPSRRRSAIALATALAAVAVALAPAASHAGTARLEEERTVVDEDGIVFSHYGVRYTAAAGEKNTVTFSKPSARRIVVHDSSAVVTPGQHCQRIDLHRAACDAPANPAPYEDVAFSSVFANLGDLDDVLTGDGAGVGVDGDGGPGDDELTGDDHRNLLWGGDGDDTLRAGDGDDQVDGGYGSDTLDGGPGRDKLSYWHRRLGEPVAVTLDGQRNDGADPNRSGISSASEEGDRDQDIEDVEGGSGPDRIVGSAADNTLQGSHGDDVFDGGPGADVFDGSAGDDKASYAGRGSDQPVVVRLDGAAGDGADPDRNGVSTEGDRDISIEHVTGGAGHDLLFGSDASNTLKGGFGADRLDGGPGSDLLDGGSGSDLASYAARAADQPVAIRLDGIRNDGADPNRNGYSGDGEERDRDVSIEGAVGGAGPDTLLSKLTGANVLSGLAGDDRIYARDGGAAKDAVNCGAGADRAQTDPADAPVSCEVAIP